MNILISNISEDTYNELKHFLFINRIEFTMLEEDKTCLKDKEWTDKDIDAAYMLGFIRSGATVEEISRECDRLLNSKNPCELLNIFMNKKTRITRST